MPLQATAGAATYDAFGGGVTAANYIEDVFSTYLYTGNGSTQTITNGIDLSTKGGLVWIKSRASTYTHMLCDTVRGNESYLSTPTSDAAVTGVTTRITSFNSNGFALGSSSFVNPNTEATASWTFRKQPKFFDVVTYTGNGSNRTISHSLGSVPGCIIVKRTDAAADWQVYHRSLANTEYMVLNDTAAKATGTTRWNSTTPTATEFSLGTDTTVNANTGTYVAYIFAHDAGGFGASGTDNVISCGSFTTDGSGVIPQVTLGYEPQWVLIRETTGPNSWFVFDNMRQMSLTNAAYLNPNSSGAEALFGYGVIVPTATGFVGQSGSPPWNSSATFIYIAIRRGPMRTPTSGTSVFSPVARTGNGSTTYTLPSGFPTDAAVHRSRTSPYGWFNVDRLRGVNTLSYNDTSAEASNYPIVGWDAANNNGVIVGNTNNAWNQNGESLIYYSFQRAPGFFDVVCYTGTGSARTVAHNLAAVPELMIVKKRSAADAWVVYANNDNTDYLVLDTTAATVDDNTIWNDTSPTSSVFTVGTNDDVNGNTATFVAYLFATVAGVSKVGSYTGTGTTLQVNCGFTAGARFVLIKRTDSTGDWYVWDSARGIVAGNDPYLLLNDTAAEVTSTDYVDTYSAGFEISSTAPAAINANGGTFIFLAIA